MLVSEVLVSGNQPLVLASDVLASDVLVSNALVLVSGRPVTGSGGPGSSLVLVVVSPSLVVVSRSLVVVSPSLVVVLVSGQPLVLVSLHSVPQSAGSVFNVHEGVSEYVTKLMPRIPNVQIESLTASSSPPKAENSLPARLGPWTPRNGSSGLSEPFFRRLSHFFQLKVRQ